MSNSIISAIVSVYLFLIGLFGLYPESGELKQGVNVDPVPYIFDKSIEGFRFLYDERELPFRIKLPANMEEGKTYPLVIFLHGSGERGDDNQCHVLPSLLKGIKKNGTACYILMPQLHADGNWQDDDVDATLTALLDYVFETYAVDTSRVYITGNSRGGAGTFDQVLRHEGKYAAAMPLCGYHASFYEGSESYEKFSKIPMWLGHSASDTIVPSSNSRGVYEAVTALGSRQIKYSEYLSLNHNCWDRFYRDADVWQWLFEQYL